MTTGRNGSTMPDYFRRRTLEVYLLPNCDFHEIDALQQRLAYEVGEPPQNRAFLVLTEHSPFVTIGRQGSRGHLRFDPEAPGAPAVRWTARGGGAWLHGPGQLAAYPIVPLHPKEFGIERYRTALHETLIETLAEFQIPAWHDAKNGGITAGGRQIATIGFAVRNWVTTYGCALNVMLPPDRDELIQSNPRVSDRLETCMLRERLLPVRAGALRESLVRNFAAAMGFGETLLCPPPPARPRMRKHVAAR
ncbi:MAG TPA: lipoyl(octanoyl) transferase LipB [Planctomycetia bacterium]|nr:lipoyl(octanoyl) transferase LipB [Planctomycetia bacterium]